MRELVTRALLAGRELLNPCLGPLIPPSDTDVEGGDRAALRSDSCPNPNSTDEDSSAAQLSRRSSVIIDLISLFRRSSSSVGKPVRLPGQTLLDQQDEEEPDEEELRSMSKEKVLEAIRQKKEAITKLRSQPWSMKRKKRALKVARKYLKRQQSKVSKWHLYKVEAFRRITQFGRWCDNMKIYLIPWEAKIKNIESHYGSVVSSYFTFLRWVLSVNITMTIIMMLFVTIPEGLADSGADEMRKNRTRYIKEMPAKEIARADELNTVLDFKGYFEYSLLFYGYYSSETYFGDTVQYKVPVAYFVVNLFILGYSFFVILRKMASNARQSKLSGGKTEQYVFNWKLFTGWDYSIGNPETANNVVMANANKFREVIAEYNVNVTKKFDCLQFSMRVFANLLVLAMEAGSVWAIYEVAQTTDKNTFIERNAVSITVSFITLTYPNFFDLISKLERYHPRTALRLQLARVLFLYILNYYTLILSLMVMLDKKENESVELPTPLSLVLSYSHPITYIYNSSEETVNSRSQRQIVFSLPFGISPFNDSTTTESPKIWTTVYPNFGPFGLMNAKAVVTNNTGIGMNTSTFVTQTIGSVDWSRNVSSKPQALSFNATAHTASASALSGNQKDECWENLIGQEITKLVTTDLVMTIASILVIDFLRGLWVRYCNLWWFWNLECTFPEYGEFKVAENVLHLVNNQGMIWLGLFFVPLLPALNNIKLIVLMYVRGWAVMTCNVPAKQIFRASRSSNFYLMLLLLMLFLCTLPVGFVIASKKPSKVCGPFGNQERFYSVITKLMKENLSKGMVNVLMHMTSPGVVIPVLLLLLLVIYFLFALVRGLKEANSDLSNQLTHERTEEKKKIFELAGGGRRRIAMDGTSKYKMMVMRKREAARLKGNERDRLSDEERSEKSSSKSSSSREHRSFVPSLKSVHEVDSEDADQEQHEPPTPPPKYSWKKKIFMCLGLDDDTRSRKHEKLLESEEEVIDETESPISAKKSTQGTSEDQQSYTSMTESYSSGSHSDEHSGNTPSFHDCASTLQDGSHGPEAQIHQDTVDEGKESVKSSGLQDSHSERSSAVENGSFESAHETKERAHKSSSHSSPSANTLQVPTERTRKHRHSSNSSSPATSITHTELRPPSSHSSRCSSVAKSADDQQSLLDPLRPESERSYIEVRGVEEVSVGRATPPSEDAAIREPTPFNDRPSDFERGAHSSKSGSQKSVVIPAISTRPEYLGLSDPRLVYSNPYSSYANAMLSPVMEMQQLGPIASGSDADDDEEKSDEKACLLSDYERPRSKESERRHHRRTEPSQSPSMSGQQSRPSRMPRFRISTSPSRRNEDSTTRQFLMRVKPGDAVPTKIVEQRGKEEQRRMHAEHLIAEEESLESDSLNANERRPHSAHKSRERHTFV